MTSRTRDLTLVVALLGWVHAGSPLGAQATRKPTNEQARHRETSEHNASRDRQQRAIQLLPSLLERIDSLKSPAWKFRLKGYLASLLASLDPEGARQLFQQSLQGLEATPIWRSQNSPRSAD